MKKAILILGAAFGLALAGCNQPQGGGSDTYSTSTGSSTNALTINTNRGASVTDTNITPKSTP